MSSIFRMSIKHPKTLAVQGKADILEVAPPSIADFSRGTSFRQLPYNGYFQGSVVAIPLSTQNPVVAIPCGFDPRFIKKAVEPSVRLLF